MSAYRSVRVDGRVTNAHRAAWEREHGPVPPGMLVMHTCDTPSCDDLEHLVLGTPSDNMRDMMAKGRGRGQFETQHLTHCPQGHRFDEANTYVDPRGCKQCRACRRAAKARHDAKRR